MLSVHRYNHLSKCTDSTGFPNFFHVVKIYWQRHCLERERVESAKTLIVNPPSTSMWQTSTTKKTYDVLPILEWFWRTCLEWIGSPASPCCNETKIFGGKSFSGKVLEMSNSKIRITNEATKTTKTTKVFNFDILSPSEKMFLSLVQNSATRLKFFCSFFDWIRCPVDQKQNSAFFKLLNFTGWAMQR